MKNSFLIQEFVNYLKFEKHFSDYTTRCYGTDMEQTAVKAKTGAAQRPPRRRLN
jgi:site-specific recombinase XerD